MILEAASSRIVVAAEAVSATSQACSAPPVRSKQLTRNERKTPYCTAHERGRTDENVVDSIHRVEDENAAERTNWAKNTALFHADVAFTSTRFHFPSRAIAGNNHPG